MEAIRDWALAVCVAAVAGIFAVKKYLQARENAA